MEQQNQQQDLKLTLNGKDYKYSECTEEQQQIVQQLNDLQNQIRIRFQIYASFDAKHHFTDLLTKSIEESSSDKSKENNKESDS